jgi:putative DNA primase/helicase
MTGAAELWEDFDPTACAICGRDACEEHVPLGPEHAEAASETPSTLVAFTFDALRAHVFPVRRTLLLRGDSPIVRDGSLGQVCAPRGVGKTWLLQTLALVAATAGDALGFRAPERSQVLYVDGEMASDEIKDRFGLLGDRLNIRPDASPALTIVGADWQKDFLPRLDTLAGQTALAPFVDAADLIILDNRSCLFDSEGEKDPTAWQPAQSLLLSLRRRNKAVLIAHHANRQGGARGISKAEDLLDLHILLARPDDYQQDQGARFLVTFDKARGFHGSAAAPFVAQLTGDGWVTRRADGQPASVADRLLEYLRLAHRADQRPRSANEVITKVGVKRNAALEAWGELLRRGAIKKHPDDKGFYAP